MTTFYLFREAGSKDHVGHDRQRILDQVQKAGFSGDLKIYSLGLDYEDSISLVIEGVYQGEQCCVAVGYGMNRANLAIRKKWHRRGGGEEV